ncbi:MAG: DUF4124 domain-containing protein [Gammaproteobacteria bacterium]|nr:DUF4124 domain-containing protein [Gammaproteobacteria bacterium]MDH3767325.1 DUF4124 domain-containing protein [Gammaproteobacteria bacterium]
MKSFPLFAILFFSASVVAAAGVYKWTDAGGAVHFSDKPPATAAEKLDIDTHRSDPEQLAALNEPEAQQDTITAEETAEQRTERERFEREQQVQRDENCTRARSAQDSLLSATRVYEPLPGGGRRYLEQDEVDQRMGDAKRDVDKWCNEKP